LKGSFSRELEKTLKYLLIVRIAYTRYTFLKNNGGKGICV